MPNLMPDLKQSFISKLSSQFPQLTAQTLTSLISDQLLSPFQVPISKKNVDQVTQFARELFQLRENPEYQKSIREELVTKNLVPAKNHAICNSYDFHVDANGDLKLIEVNTNAAFMTMGEFMYQAHGLKVSSSLKEDILNELRECGIKTDKPRIAIVDEKPEEQRLYVEFLVVCELIRSWGWTCEILDVSQITADAPFDLIYNRSTDFFLQSADCAGLRELYNSGRACVSPHPFEYALIADKERMIDWKFPVVPQSTEVTTGNAEELWAKRKTLFFKPLRSFGAKQSYRGSSVSRRVFDEIVGQGFLAQEFVPAPELEITTPEGPIKFKYDLRFYVYRDQVSFGVARLYQGQTTNLRTPYGGFAPLVQQ